MEPAFQDGGRDSPKWSESPQRTPQISQGLTSPARSVRPEMTLGSLISQGDLESRTNFFDDTSEDDIVPADVAGLVPDADATRKRTSAERRMKTASASSEPFIRCGSRAGISKTDSGCHATLSAPFQGPTDSAHSSISSRISLEEMLPSDYPSSPPPNRQPAGSPTTRAPRKSAHVDNLRARSDSDAAQSKADQILNAHAIAHEITLKALLRDDDTMTRGMSSADRSSPLPYSSRLSATRSFRESLVPPPAHRQKKVAIVSPPIDLEQMRQVSSDIVHTPYPFEDGRTYHRNFSRTPLRATPTSPSRSESLLTLSIRRSNPNSRPRVIAITIPASNDFTAVKTARQPDKELHFRALEFDDAELFKHIRSSYRTLAGPIRFFSARSLSRITVSGNASRAADAGYGWLHQPRSPRMLAQKSLGDAFSEQQVMQHYRRPSLGKSRFAFVQWAHRLAAAPETSQYPRHADEKTTNDVADAAVPRSLEQAEGLEFVLSWSLWRILGFFALVLLASAAAALCWTLLGKNTVAGVASGGFRNAGDRVEAGALMGICVLLLGLSCMAGWLGISWVVM